MRHSAAPSFPHKALTIVRLISHQPLSSPPIFLEAHGDSPSIWLLLLDLRDAGLAALLEAGNQREPAQEAEVSRSAALQATGLTVMATFRWVRRLPVPPEERGELAR